jgi:4-amino-4-deoxy-L-arabinose transferase-like glycosyltransferase
VITPALRWWAALVLAVVAARVGFIAARGIQAMPDTVSYKRYATNIVEHHAFSLDTSEPFRPSIRRPPLYPAVLACLRMTVGDSHNAIVALQILFDVLTAIVTVLLARRVVSHPWALAAGFAVALHPGAIAASATLLTESLFTVCLLAGVWGVVAAHEQRSGSRATIAGLGIGLATLCRTVAMPLAVLLPLVAWRPRATRRTLLVATLVLVVAVAVVTPWTIRSSRAAGRFVFLQINAGELLYTAARTDIDQKRGDVWSIVAQDLGLGVTSAAEMARTDREAMQRGLALIAANPWGYLTARLREWPYLFLTSYDNFTGLNQSFGTVFVNHDWVRLGVKLGLLVVGSLLPLLLAMVGAFVTFRTVCGRVVTAVWVFAGLVHLPMWLEPRYFQPAMPLVFVAAAAGAARLWSFIGSRVSGQSARA